MARQKGRGIRDLIYYTSIQTKRLLKTELENAEDGILYCYK